MPIHQLLQSFSTAITVCVNLPSNVDTHLGTIEFNTGVALERLSKLPIDILRILARVAKVLDDNDNGSGSKGKIQNLIRQEGDSDDELMTALNEGVKSTLLSLSPDNEFSLNGSIRKVSLLIRVCIHSLP